MPLLGRETSRLIPPSCDFQGSAQFLEGLSTSGFAGQGSCEEILQDFCRESVASFPAIKEAWRIRAHLVCPDQ